VPESRWLVANLLSGGAGSQFRLVCLCKIAATQSGASLLLADVKWMHAGCLDVKDSLIVFLTIARFPALRSQLMESSAFAEFVTWVSEAGDKADLEAVCPVLRRFDPPVAVLRALDNAGFFKAYIPRCFASESPQLVDAVVMLTDKLCRKGWANGFAYFTRELPGLFARGGPIAHKALIAALALAAQPQAKPLFLEVDVLTPLKAVALEPGDVKYRDMFLKFLGAA
jgi:hypothetical protein